ncbi:MAG: DUF2371 domain-containing protein [Bacilli bacterium]|nr:DUF2371 domain-containing protein [Bacilli bacterium]
MSKKYKQKFEKKDIEEDNNSNLSKKELYDLEQKQKRERKEKEKNKKKKKTDKSKKKKKTYSTNLAGKIFAIVMLILMVGSVIATISYYFTGGR